MFLLRCTFWLSIVYASMSWGIGAARPHDAVASTARRPAMLDGAAERAVASIAGICQAHGAQCLKDAASLTTLVQTSLQQADADEADETELANVAVAPLPAPRPRVASAVLTRGR